MRVLLIQNVPGLGKIDEVKEVTDGYARNYLFAKNLAVPATLSLLADVEGKKRRQAVESEKELQREQSMAARLDGWELEVTEKAGAAGVLYAAVGPQKVADALRKSGFAISKNQIIMKPVKEAGEYKAKVRFSHGLEADITIIVNTA